MIEFVFANIIIFLFSVAATYIMFKVTSQDGVLDKYDIPYFKIIVFIIYCLAIQNI